MTFEEWWDKNASGINKVMQSPNFYIKPFFFSAYLWGRDDAITKETEGFKTFKRQIIIALACGGIVSLIVGFLLIGVYK